MRRIYFGLSILTGLILATTATAAESDASQHPPMPAGHPDISAMMSGAGPTSRPIGKGVVSVRIVQKTPGAPGVGVIPFNIELVHHDQVMATIPGQTDARGVKIVDGIPVELPVVPRVVVNYKGMTFSATGERELSSPSRFEDIEVPIYEVTEQEPAWAVQIRHVALQADDQGNVIVSDVFQVHNPSDRAYKKIALTIPIPDGVARAELGGGSEGSDVQWKDHKAIVSMPLLPGDSGFHLDYQLQQGAKVALAFTAPRQLEAMKLMVPRSLSVQVDGLSKSAEAMGQLDIYQGKDLPTGHVATVTILSQAQPANSGGAFASAPKLIAIIGGGLILVIGAAIMLMKGKKSELADSHRPRG